MNSRLPNSNVLLLVRLNGVVLQEKLEEAILKVSKKHLLLNSKLKIDADNRIWYEVNDIMQPAINCTPYRVDLDEVMLAELKKPFDLEAGPLIRFNIINFQEQTQIVITCHHVICDGLALVYLTNDILAAIAHPQKEIDEVKRLVLQDESTVPAKVKDNLLAKLIVGNINKRWQRRNLSFTPAMYNDIHEQFWKKHHPGIVRWGLTTEQTSQLVKQAKNHGITVNTALVTAFLGAQNEILDSKSYSEQVTISVSIRDYLKESPQDALGFFAAAVRPKLKYAAKKSFWENAVHFHRQIKSLLTEHKVFESQLIGFFNPQFIDALALGRHGYSDDRVVKKMIAKKKLNVVNTTFTLTNLGKLNIQNDFNGLKLTSLTGPVVYGDNMEKYIGVITINGQMFFSISFNQNIIGKDKIEKIKNKVIHYIEQFGEPAGE